MNKRIYGGWHGVTDPKRMLLAVSYEPIEGTLACRFATREEPYLHSNVPENIFHILTRSPFAGAYYRKHVMRKYPLLVENTPPSYEPENAVPEKKLAVQEIPTGTPETQMGLFPTGPKATKKRSMRSSRG